MRFLLSPGFKSTQAVLHEARSVKSKPAVMVSMVSSSNDGDSSYTKSWGQQCSPNCGCVVRFEAIVDRGTQKIVQASYVAKSIVSIQKDGRLEPVRTNRTNRPMLKECKCNTVHTLAKEITSFISTKNIDSVRNMSEFSCTRSSPAFRHAVLVDNQLPRTDTHCFDVVEEAFTAVIKGFLPRQRRNMNSFDTILSNHLLGTTFQDQGDMGCQQPTTGSEQRLDNTNLSLSSPRSVSTLSMFDINAEYWENEEHHKMEQQERQNMKMSLDWLSFVDEQNRDEKWA